ncbi:MAG: DUF3738 domain-containing protein [Daejeonella sp.]|uniref:TlpA family protein disulfide reductase n=1 Tax=Daejeonella sp. TaxID=2805397 RepID=UPI002732DB0D|nr:DUF3738 domain-containing protein [Daejeonella sp.]MDP3467556.1 DUF3738 domain-containing protein [Daejeonella sp.]
MKSKYTSKLILMIFSMLSYLPAGSQTKSNKALSIGDHLPAIHISKILNSTKAVRKIQDNTEKHLIIDFWSPYCSYSVKTFKELDSIQQLFTKDLEIIRVTRQTDLDLRKLFVRSEIASNSKLPLVYSDSTLREFFPIELPHQVWVDNKGIIRAIANPQNFTVKNVKKLIQNEGLNLLPMDHFQNFNPAQPLFMQAKMSFLNNLEQFSYYTRYINGINQKAGNTIDPITKQVIRRAYYNMSVKNLIKLAYDSFGSGEKYGALSDDRRVIYEKEDPERFFIPKDNNELIEWEWNNTYCYEIKVLPENADRLPKMMQEDLQRFFNVSINEETRIVDGYALIISDKNKIPLSSGKGRSLTLYNQKSGITTIENQLVKQLIKSLEGKLRNDIIVDETNFKERLLLHFKGRENVHEMREELKKFGFDLIPKQVETKILVVR